MTMMLRLKRFSVAEFSTTITGIGKVEGDGCSDWTARIKEQSLRPTNGGRD